MATGMHMDERSVDCLVLGHHDQDRKVSSKSVTMRAMTLCKNLSGYRELLLIPNLTYSLNFAFLTQRGLLLRGSRNFRQGGPGQSVKKKLRQRFFFFFFFFFKSSAHLSSRGGPTFSRGGGLTFSGGGVQLLIPYRNPYNL